MRMRMLRLSALLAGGLVQLGCDAVPSEPAPQPTPAVSPPTSEAPPPPPPEIAPVPEPPPPLAPLFAGKTVRAEHSAPVAGGTLLVTRDGSTIVAADPDRDAVFLVNSASHAVTALSLSRGDEPGRIAEGSDGTVYVALRGAGALIQIDVPSAKIVQRVAVCASPRGVAFDAQKASLYVACRSGQLLSLDASTLSRTRAVQLDSDLRDVIVREHDLVVTRFASAEVMVVADDGSVARRAKPEFPCGDATVLYRAFAMPGGQVALAHQLSSNAAVGVGSGAYGGSSCGSGLVTRVFSTVDVDTPSNSGSVGAPSFGSVDLQTEVAQSSMTFHSATVPGAGPLDIALDASGTRVAVIAMDDQLVAARTTSIVAGLDPASTLWLTTWDNNPGGISNEATFTSVTVAGQPVAVAFSANGKFIVQSREPATLELEGGTSVRLSNESHADSGHLMFHMNSGIGIACASCHPEGGDDGHVWRFPEGLRRTMPLEGGVLQRAPFHWDGTLTDMTALVNTVMVTRMGLLSPPTDEQISALGGFLEQLPELPPADGLDPAAIARGEALFRRADVACSSCHSGPQFTDNELVDVGTGGKFVTPTLLGVGLRPALFHDGCAKSIAERFGVCGGTAHGKPELLSTDERADLITFLRSL